jgi:CubicO group peptidase (beta-lactamase class C family)
MLESAARAIKCQVAIMNSIPFHLAVLLTLANGFASAHAAFDASKIDDLVKDAQKAFDVPGVAVAIVKDGEVIYLKAFGVKELGKTDPVTPDTLFPLASCTKAFTTTAMAILVDEGKMAWDDPVRKHVEFFHLSDPLADADVRMRDLVCHRTGLAGHDLLWYRAPWKPEEAIRRIGHVKLDKPFRGAFQYQSTMFTSAGYGVGTASKSTWKDFVQTRILNPLEMKATVFTTADAEKGDHALPHRKNLSGEVVSISVCRMEYPDAAASIHASARDLANWVKFQLGDGTWHGKRIVSAKNLGETHTAQMAIRVEGLTKAMNPESHVINYGMGWVLQDYRGVELISHAGAIDGFRVHLTLVPEAKLGIVLLANLHQTRMNLPLSNSIVDLMLGLPKKDWNAHFLELQKKDEADTRDRAKERAAKRHQGTKPSRELGAYTGSYEDEAFGTAKVSLEDGQLVWKWGTFTCPLEHYHYDTFIAKSDFLGNPMVVFTFGSDGEVKTMDVQDAVGIEFKKVREKKP